MLSKLKKTQGECISLSQIKDEIKYLLYATFIISIDFIQMVSNTVLVGKLDGRIRIYTNFRDLNKAFPKDDFIFHNIYTLVKNTMGYEMISLMDGFFSYNQVYVTPIDQHKTTFTTPWRTFCYKVMPFHLKNIGVNISTCRDIYIS